MNVQRPGTGDTRAATAAYGTGTGIRYVLAPTSIGMIPEVHVTSTDLRIKSAIERCGVPKRRA